MSISRIVELARAEAEKNSDGEYTYTRRFLIFSDTATEDIYEVANYASLPQLGDVHPSDSGATCKSVRPVQNDENRTLWEIEVKYSSGRVSRSMDRPTRPWNRKPELSWGVYAREEAFVTDGNGVLVRNSAGDRFLPPRKIEKHFPSLRLTRYQRDFDMTEILLYIDKVNSAPTRIAGYSVSAGQALMVDIRGVEVEMDGVECWEVTYDIRFADTWITSLLDEGFYYWVDGTKVPYKDDEGNESKTPALLDGEGGLLVDPLTTEPEYLDFLEYGYRDFRPLGLD